MLTLRRILKYTPAVVLGTLVAAWVVSWFIVCGISNGSVAFEIHPGSAVVSWGGESSDSVWRWRLRKQRIEDPIDILGVTWTLWEIRETRWGQGAVTVEYPHVYVPLPLLITLYAPIAVGPFVSFRFRLWHYLAYTALVAVELAYYLRW